MKGRVGAFASALIGIALTSAEAHAELYTCDGTVGAVTLDDVVVPPDQSCTLHGTTVQGTISVETNAVLTARDVNVVGNIQGENAATVDVLDGSSVGGSVQVVQGGSARVLGSQITADVLFDGNSGALEARRNVIGGNLQVFQNTGGAEIYRNQVDGNLQCKENQPPPQGAGNVVEGSIEDQCTGFDAPIGSTTTTVPATTTTVPLTTTTVAPTTTVSPGSTTTIPPTTTLPSGTRCGQPVTDGAQPMASDCLYILRAAVGSEQCSPECVCDTDGSLAVSASDALLCLKVAVGQTVELRCPCD